MLFCLCFVLFCFVLFEWERGRGGCDNGRMSWGGGERGVGGGVLLEGKGDFI